jgi:DNA-binding response OmpR family regulator
VATAAAGLEALLKVSLERPHARLLDVHLPDISGLDVLRRVRESGNQIPVLVITGNAPPHAGSLGRDLGDLDEDVYRRLEAHVVRGRRSVGLS